MRRHRRQRAQTFTIAAFGITAMIGALSMVIDAGVYFVLQRQLQNAADAAALAAVWYAPACDANWLGQGCQVGAFRSHPANCTDPTEFDPCTAATNWVQANATAALSLCAGPNLPAGQIPVNVVAKSGQPLLVPQLNTWVVTVTCDAPHWFGRILPGVNLTMTIRASASAALGWLGNNGQIFYRASPPGTPPPPLVARLII